MPSVHPDRRFLELWTGFDTLPPLRVVAYQAIAGFLLLELCWWLCGGLCQPTPCPALARKFCLHVRPSPYSPLPRYDDVPNPVPMSSSS